jgi:hypothetical protein
MYKTLKFAAVLASLFFTIPSAFVLASEFSNAIDAMQNENYQYSSAVWSRLSQQGDILADYNMALNLKRMSAKPEEQKSWLRIAARERLVTAYGRLHPGSIKPAKIRTSSVQLYINPDDWVKIQNPGHYTLQLASSTHLQSIDKIYTQKKLKGQGSYFKNLRQGQARYTLVYGAYATAADARSAINKLPKELRKWKPWVRSIKSIQKSMKSLE